MAIPSGHTPVERPAQWRLFPAVRTVAFYDSLAQYIELSDYDSATLRQALAGAKDDPAKALPVLPVLLHELRHWIDHIATLWGRRRLIAAFNAIHCRIHNDPSEFWRIVEYRRLVSQDRFSDYFTIIENPTPPSHVQRHWQYQLTCGKRFDHTGRQDDSRPIFFTRFAWPDNSNACRVPFSVTSLLEAGAMHFEAASELSFAIRLGGIDRHIELNTSHDRRMRELYDPHFAAYSAAVHLIANRTNTIALNDAYPIAGALSSLCLNLPDGMFDALKVPDEFGVWGELNRAAIQRRDRGYAFILVAYHGDREPHDDPNTWIERAVSRAGLPPIAAIQECAGNEMARIESEILDGPHIERLRGLCKTGDSLFSRMGILPTVESALPALSEVELPPVLCADVQWLSPKYSPNEVEKWCFFCSDIARRFDEFASACAI